MRRKHIISRILGIFILLVSLNISATGQQETWGFSINPKAGFYNISKENGGLISGQEFYLFKNKKIYSIDFYGGEEPDFIGSPSPNEHFGSVGFMIGKYEGTKVFRFTYQGGLSLFWGERRTDLKQKGTGFFATDIYNTKDFFTVGIPLKLGFKIIPSRFFSIGIDLQANLNIENPVYMPMISLEFGKLRDRINRYGYVSK